MQTPSTNFEPLLTKQNSIKGKMSSIASAIEVSNPSAATKIRQARDKIDFYNRANLAIFDPSDPCSAFSFIEATGTLFGFDPDMFDYYAETKQTVEKMWQITNDIPLKILSEIDSYLDQIDQTVGDINDIATQVDNTVDDGTTQIDNAISSIEDSKSRILKDHKKVLFVLAAMSMPVEDLQLFLDKAKFFEQTVLIPCSGYWKAKLLENFRDEYGLIDVENILNQKQKIMEIVNTFPDSAFQ